MRGMGWSSLGTQFCLELAFGVFVALAFVPKAPVGRLFYRIMGSVAIVPLIIAGLVPVSQHLAEWTDLRILATWIAIAVVVVELFAIALIRRRYMDTPLLRAMFGTVIGGLIVFGCGVLIGRS